MTSDNELKSSSTSASLSLPVLRIRIHSLHEIESSGGVVEMSHFVAVVGDELQEIERLGRLL